MYIMSANDKISISRYCRYVASLKKEPKSRTYSACIVNSAANCGRPDAPLAKSTDAGTMQIDANLHPALARQDPQNQVGYDISF